jgi:hypothetical protein
VLLTLDLVGLREELFEERPGELLAFDYVLQARTDGHEKSSFPASLGPDLKEPGARSPLGGLYLRQVNKRPGHVVVTTEVAMCSFCGRPRTLRNEQHQLGSLVRTIVTCETCHRTLSSTMSVASPETAEMDTAEVGATSNKAAGVESTSGIAKPSVAAKPRTTTAKPKTATAKAKAPAKTTRRTK